MNKMLVIGTLVSSLGFSAAHAADVSVVDMALLSADGNQAIGEIVISETDYGLVFTPNLKGLSAGQHGFHVHANGSCDPSTKEGKTVLGGAAGGHFDPDNTGKHGYPWTKDNHKGDLPSLSVNADGTATTPVLAPRLTASDIKGKAIMVHIGGDNHSDYPAPLGGGGARMACGVAK